MFSSPGKIFVIRPLAKAKEGENEHFSVSASCSEKLICVGKDGEMEVKEEYRGKIIYQEEDRKEDLVMRLCLGNFFQI